MPKGIKGFLKGVKRNGSDNPHWKGGTPKCSICDKQLVSYVAKNCRACFYKKISGEKNHFWKGGIMSTRNRRKHSITRGAGVLKHETIIRLIEENKIKHGSLSCQYCLKELSEKNYCLDHKVPVKRGGKSNYSNLSICCKGCNNSKGNYLLKEWKNKKEKHRVISQ